MEYLRSPNLICIISFLQHLLNGVSTECCRYCERDCQDLQDLGHVTSGVYNVIPKGTYKGVDVYCDMATEGGGWLVFQRRVDGSEDFYQTWKTYKSGFGNVSHEHWLGLYPLRRILVQGFYELRIDMEDWGGEKAYASYHEFMISDSDDQFRLKVASYEGTAGDSLSPHSGAKFSAPDKDNDVHDIVSCAQEYRGAWWYHSCYHANLNGVFGNTNEENSIIWGEWKGKNHSLKAVEMKIRRV